MPSKTPHTLCQGPPLPPNLAKPTRAFVHLYIGRVVWNSFAPTPRSFHIRARWWGEKGVGALFRPGSPLPPPIYRYPVVLGKKAFQRYLDQMNKLLIDVIALPEKRVIARAKCPVAHLLQAPIDAQIPVIGDPGEKWGTIHVRIAHENDPLVGLALVQPLSLPTSSHLVRTSAEQHPFSVVEHYRHRPQSKLRSSLDADKDSPSETPDQPSMIEEPRHVAPIPTPGPESPLESSPSSRVAELTRSASSRVAHRYDDDPLPKQSTPPRPSSPVPDPQFAGRLEALLERTRVLYDALGDPSPDPSPPPCVPSPPPLSPSPPPSPPPPSPPRDTQKVRLVVSRLESSRCHLDDQVFLSYSLPTVSASAIHKSVATVATRSADGYCDFDCVREWTLDLRAGAQAVWSTASVLSLRFHTLSKETSSSPTTKSPTRAQLLGTGSLILEGILEESSNRDVWVDVQRGGESIGRVRCTFDLLPFDDQAVPPVFTPIDSATAKVPLALLITLSAVRHLSPPFQQTPLSATWRLGPFERGSTRGLHSGSSDLGGTWLDCSKTLPVLFHPSMRSLLAQGLMVLELWAGNVFVGLARWSTRPAAEFMGGSVELAHGWLPIVNPISGEQHGEVSLAVVLGEPASIQHRMLTPSPGPSSPVRDSVQEQQIAEAIERDLAQAQEEEEKEEEKEEEEEEKEVVVDRTPTPPPHDDPILDEASDFLLARQSLDSELAEAAALFRSTVAAQAPVHQVSVTIVELVRDESCISEDPVFVSCTVAGQPPFFSPAAHPIQGAPLVLFNARADLTLRGTPSLEIGVWTRSLSGDEVLRSRGALPSVVLERLFQTGGSTTEDVPISPTSPGHTVRLNLRLWRAETSSPQMITERVLSAPRSELVVQVQRASGLQDAAHAAGIEGPLSPAITFSLLGYRGGNIHQIGEPCFCPIFDRTEEMVLDLDKQQMLERAQAGIASFQLWHSTSDGSDPICLGEASVPLFALIQTQRGVHGWFAVRRSDGQAVGAIQVRIAWKANPLADVGISTDGDWLVRSSWTRASGAGAPGLGFLGQQARLTVFVEELVVPKGINPGAPVRIVYRVLGRGMKEIQGVGDGSDRVKFGHTETYECKLDAEMLEWLGEDALEMHVQIQGEGIGEIHMGLTPLLSEIPQVRFVGGVFVVVHPEKSMLGGRLRAKVLLEVLDREREVVEVEVVEDGRGLDELKGDLRERLDELTRFVEGFKSV